jgi:hypothetical protein
LTFRFAPVVGQVPTRCTLTPFHLTAIFQRFLGRKHTLGYFHNSFGLTFHSNLPLPGVPLVSKSPDRPDDVGQAPCDINLHLGVAPADSSLDTQQGEELTYTSSYLDDKNLPVLHIWQAVDRSYLRLAYADGTQFWIDQQRLNIWAAWPEKLSLENTFSYLLGPVLGLLLRLRGITCLHASAVAFDDWCAVFVGAEGAGKSTTAAAFAAQGQPVLSDDVVALELASPVSPRSATPDIRHTSLFHVSPAYPHICLWPDSAQMVPGLPENLPPLAPDWDKRRLALGTDGILYASEPLPLAAIYVFAERRAASAPAIEPCLPKNALLSLVANTYANKVLSPELRAQEFSLLDRLVASVPARILTPHSDPARLAEMCSLIRQDLAFLPRPSPMQ